MLGKKQQADVMRAAEAVAITLRQAIQATVDHRTPEAGRQTVLAIVDVGTRALGEDGANPAVMMTTHVLLHDLSAVRQGLTDQPDRVERVLGWIEENLGKRYALRARYTSAALETAEGLDDIAAYTEALAEDFMPSLVWLLAGAVAVYGDGDAQWLARLTPAATRA